MRVLLVEDDRDSALTLLALLRDDHHAAEAVHTFADALRAIVDFDPDAVLIDIGLPDGSGYELAREIRTRLGDARPYLVAVTGSNKGSDKALAHMLGFNEHLGKPYDPARLLTLLRDRKNALIDD